MHDSRTFGAATRSFDEGFAGAHLLHLRLDADAETRVCEIPAREAGRSRHVLPLRPSANPEHLVGGRVVVLRAADAATRDRTTPFWFARIESVAVEGEHLVVTTRLQSGTPHMQLLPEPDEILRYEIDPRPFATPRVLRVVASLQEFVEERRDLEVGGTLGPADFVGATNFIVEKRAEGSRSIPDDSDRIDWLWKQYGRIRGEERLRRVVDDGYGSALVTVFLKEANYRDTRSLMEALRDYEEEHLAPAGLRLSFAGDVAVSQALIAGVVTTQVRSLLFSLVGIFLVTSILARSLRVGLVSVVPCAAAVAALFAVMGWAGWNLGVATSMFAGMVLGIGIDYAIHLIEHTRTGIGRGLKGEDALAEAAGAVGPAILVDATAVALGFGALTLSRVPANASLGAVSMLCVVACLGATLLLLPALLGTRPFPAPGRE